MPKKLQLIAFAMIKGTFTYVPSKKQFDDNTKHFSEFEDLFVHFFIPSESNPLFDTRSGQEKVDKAVSGLKFHE
jgi:hypothetical protein